MLHTKVHNCRIMAKFKRLRNRGTSIVYRYAFICALAVFAAIEKLDERIFKGSTGE